MFAIQGGFSADKHNTVDKKSGPQSLNALQGKSMANMAKVTGIGGVFFKSKKDQKALSEWYSKNLGIPLEPWGGAILKWNDDKAG